MAEPGTAWQRGPLRKRGRGMATALGGGAVALAVAGRRFVQRTLRAQQLKREGISLPLVETKPLARSLTINASPEQLAQLWKDPSVLSQLLQPIAEVSQGATGQLLWKVEALGVSKDWETRFVEERPGELLRWQSSSEDGVPKEGWLRFRPAPADLGTVATLFLGFAPVGDIAAGVLVRSILRRFKSLAETGEIPTLRGNPSARRRVEHPERDRGALS